MITCNRCVLAFVRKVSDLFHRGLINKLRSYQIVKVLADLPDDSRESWSEQLLHVGGP